MGKLAIKGHPKRGKEVIELLKMMGGVDWDDYAGNRLNSIYYISETKDISFKDIKNIDFKEEIKKFVIFTLEEFLEKFPYKIGNKVIYRNNIFCIKSSQWNSEKNTVIYYIDADWSAGYVVETSNLQPYKEETMDKANKAVFDANTQCCDIMNHIINEKTMEIKIDIPKGYEFAGVDDDKQQVVFTKIGYHYPNTYEECCEVLGIDIQFCMKYLPHGTLSYKDTLIYNLKALIICRDAYWKIAGEEMGLNKPWEPDWTTNCTKYVIRTLQNNIVREFSDKYNEFLAFPTEEMRDAFYENFKDLIECCKELL